MLDVAARGFFHLIKTDMIIVGIVNREKNETPKNTMRTGVAHAIN
jgi:hypothetical protein